MTNDKIAEIETNKQVNTQRHPAPCHGRLLCWRQTPFFHIICREVYT